MAERRGVSSDAAAGAPSDADAGAGAPGDAAAGREDAAGLRDLEARLQRATEAAERLFAEAGAPRTVPPSGWQARAHEPTEDPGGEWIDADDAQRLLALLAGLRERVPAELQQRVMAALRELLTALRALIDWCLERAERRRAAPVEVQDIPIL